MALGIAPSMGGFTPRRGKLYVVVEAVNPTLRHTLGRTVRCLEPGSPKGLPWGMARMTATLWETDEVVDFKEGVRLKPLSQTVCGCPHWGYPHHWRPGCPVED